MNLSLPGKGQILASRLGEDSESNMPYIALQSPNGINAVEYLLDSLQQCLAIIQNEQLYKKKLFKRGQQKRITPEEYKEHLEEPIFEIAESFVDSDIEILNFVNTKLSEPSIATERIKEIEDEQEAANKDIIYENYYAQIEEYIPILIKRYQQDVHKFNNYLMEKYYEPINDKINKLNNWLEENSYMLIGCFIVCDDIIDHYRNKIDVLDYFDFSRSIRSALQQIGDTNVVINLTNFDNISSVQDYIELLRRMKLEENANICEQEYTEFINTYKNFKSTKFNIEQYIKSEIKQMLVRVDIDEFLAKDIKEQHALLDSTADNIKAEMTVDLDVNTHIYTDVLESLLKSSDNDVDIVKELDKKLYTALKNDALKYFDDTKFEQVFYQYANEIIEDLK